LTSALDEVSGQLHARAEEPLVPHWLGGWVDPRAVLDEVAGEKIPAPAESRTPVVQPVDLGLLQLQR